MLDLYLLLFPKGNPMYLRRFVVDNVRSISNVQMDFKAGEEAGWHVILGSNGSGKSSLVRAFALVLMGEKEAYASRQDFNRWMRADQSKATIEAQVSGDAIFDDVTGSGARRGRLITVQANLEIPSDMPIKNVEVKFSGNGFQRTIWGGGAGWFSASFGPFRRFTGGDNKYDRLFVTNKRLAPHLTALGEDVALTDAMGWLSSLFLLGLQDEKNGLVSEKMALLAAVSSFLNASHFLPHNATISSISGDNVEVSDGNGFDIPLDQLSDGYRSALSLVLELIRQMVELYGSARMLSAIDAESGSILAPGVVMIDEVDAHLHPTWQRDIGHWLTKCFPHVQFLVTTHSPIVCRAVDKGGELKGSIWKLPAPGSTDSFRRVDDVELNRLVYGDVIDAYSTELFGTDVIRSLEGEHKINRLAELNLKALEERLTSTEEAERKQLRIAFPAQAGSF
ncbi:AAA family ATPase [Rugamonas rivuli]|uniref:AAA family ATPase n=1 Tax=Rugamonas rivuli TaxID=2743358 RepID=A0A843SH59_9BURK|nr:AAA family ATPase [Rugamonas rivuli]MQA21523.1 AAA family ATPase [Rugamonas rivuli]